MEFLLIICIVKSVVPVGRPTKKVFDGIIGYPVCNNIPKSSIDSEILPVSIFLRL